MNFNEEPKTLLNTTPVAKPTTTEESDQLNVQKTIDNKNKQTLKPVTSSSQLQLKQQQKVDYQHIVAPKPYKKTVSAATLANPTPLPTTTTTANTLPNQVLI